MEVRKKGLPLTLVCKTLMMAGLKRALLEALRSGVGEMLPTLAWHKRMQDNEVLDEQIDR